METFEHKGREYKFSVEPDDDTTPPWKQWDWLGEPEYRRNRYGARYQRKYPGEVILTSDRHGAWFYPQQQATAKARREGSSGTEAAAIVAHEINRQRRWLNGDWYLATVTVRRADACECCGPSECIGGVESDCHDHITDDLLPEMIADLETQYA